MSFEENVTAALWAIAIDLFINNETRDWSDRMGVPL